ncbi:uncharacterized protein [Drosophila takahashii]|uniref:uncharacterized protein n=1 Tax=Drosophila takahashii TaxID=29030 RepID=UPI00389918CB
MPTGIAGDATADENRVIFLKRKATALFNRVERLVDSLSSAALTSCDESGLHVRLELIDELQGTFKKVLGELEELDFEEIESDLSEKFDDILVLLKSSVRSEISKRASQLLSHSTLADGITPGAFGLQQRQPRHRATLLPPLELPKFAGGYANWSDFYSMFTTIIDSHPDLTNIEKLQHLRSCLRDTALETIRSLEISDGNYAIALDLLQNRFDNRRLVFQAHITEILGIKAVQSGSVSTLRELSDKFNAHIRALKGLGTTEQIAGCIIVQILFQKLDPASQAKWEERLEDPAFVNLIPTWESMASFLEQRCRTLETMDFAMANYAPGIQSRFQKTPLIWMC